MKKLQEAQFWARAGDHKFSLTKLYLEMPIRYLGLPRWLSGKEYMPMQQTQVRSLGQKDPLEEKMATYSSILAWKIP